MTFDFSREELSFGEAQNLPHSSRFYAGLSFIPVTMRAQGRALQLMLDTGASGLVLYAEAVDGRLEIEATGRAEYRGHVGGRVRMKEILLHEVSLGDSYWATLSAYLIAGPNRHTVHVMGNLGVTSLGFRILQLDFERGQLSWTF